MPIVRHDLLRSDLQGIGKHIHGFAVRFDPGREIREVESRNVPAAGVDIRLQSNELVPAAASFRERVDQQSVVIHAALLQLNQAWTKQLFSPLQFTCKQRSCTNTG